MHNGQNYFYPQAILFTATGLWNSDICLTKYEWVSCTLSLLPPLTLPGKGKLKDSLIWVGAYFWGGKASHGSPPFPPAERHLGGVFEEGVGRSHTTKQSLQGSCPVHHWQFFTIEISAWFCLGGETAPGRKKSGLVLPMEKYWGHFHFLQGQLQE